MAKAMSMVYALRLKGENKKRLLVGRLKIASRRAEMHLSHGKYVMDKHNTRRHCIGDSCLILPSKQQNAHIALRK
jgi:peptide methionine sulfoxide reductase MsrB